MRQWIQRNRIEIAAAGLYALLYLVLWPVSVTTMDESAYLNYAYVFRHGTIFSSDLGISTVQSYGVGPGKANVLSLYPPGMSASLAAASVFGWQFALGMNLIVHLATLFVLAALLRRMGAPGWLAILHLLHPTAVVYSHTLMSDPLSGLLLLIAFAACVDRRHAAAGGVIGVSVFVRTANGIAAGFFALGLALEALGTIVSALRQGKINEALRAMTPAVLVSLGAIPFIAGAWAYQKFIQEGGWAKYAGEGLLGLQHFPRMFPSYVLMLSVLYPGMILAPALYHGAKKTLLITLSYGFLLFYSCFYFQDSAGSKLESFVIGQRFMLAVMPLYILAYGETLHRFARTYTTTRLRIAVPALVFAGLFCVAGVGLEKHQRYLRELSAVRNAVATHVPADAALFCNVHTAKLLHPAWTGKRQYQVIGGYHDRVADIRDTRQRIQKMLNSGKREVYVAIWSRAYRPETPGEQSIADSVQQTFLARPVESGVKGMRILAITGH